MPVATRIPGRVGIYWLRIPVVVAAPPMPVATPIPWGVGIYWLRNHGRCVIARHHWSCVDRSWHHVDWRGCLKPGGRDQRGPVRREGGRGRRGGPAGLTENGLAYSGTTTCSAYQR